LFDKTIYYSSELSESSISGRSGGFNYLLYNFYQSMLEKNGCCLISFIDLEPKRFLGSLSKRPDIKLLAT